MRAIRPAAVELRVCRCPAVVSAVGVVVICKGAKTRAEASAHPGTSPIRGHRRGCVKVGDLNTVQGSRIPAAIRKVLAVARVPPLRAKMLWVAGFRFYTLKFVHIPHTNFAFMRFSEAFVLYIIMIAIENQGERWSSRWHECWKMGRLPVRVKCWPAGSRISSGTRSGGL